MSDHKEETTADRRHVPWPASDNMPTRPGTSDTAPASRGLRSVAKTEKSATLTFLHPLNGDTKDAKWRVRLGIQHSCPGAARSDNATQVFEGFYDPNHFLVKLEPSLQMDQMTFPYGTLRYNPKGVSSLSLFGKLSSGWVVKDLAFNPSEASRGKVDEVKARPTGTGFTMEGTVTNSGDPQDCIPLGEPLKMQVASKRYCLVDLTKPTETSRGTVNQLILLPKKIRAERSSWRGTFELQYFLEPPLPSTVPSNQPHTCQSRASDTPDHPSAGREATTMTGECVDHPRPLGSIRSDPTRSSPRGRSARSSRRGRSQQLLRGARSEQWARSQRSAIQKR